MEEVTAKDRVKISSLVFLALVIAVMLVWFLFANHYMESFFALKAEEAGQFGDSFGVLTCLFSGLAMIGVFYTIHLQRVELSAMSKEFKEQNETLKIQKFENTFFNLLKLHNDCVNELDYVSRRGHLHGVDIPRFEGRLVFTIVYQEIIAHFFPYESQNSELGIINKLLRAFNALYQESGEHFGHYFKTFYSVLKFLDQSSMEDKRPYINILLAQISNSQGMLILLYSINSCASRDFKDLIKKHKILTDLNSIFFAKEVVDGYQEF